MTVIDWLLDSDPAIRWQVLRDLTDATASEVNAERALTDATASEVNAERARVASEGWGAELLAAQAADGYWGGAAWLQNEWVSTMHVLWLLRDFGLDPASADAQRATALVRDNVVWSGWEAYEGKAFFVGEVEPCINGQVASIGAYFHHDVGGIIDRLLGEQLVDGGWNCEAENGSTRSSFNTTICVLEALLEYERTNGSDPAVTGARLRGETYLLDRHLFRRLSTGEAITSDRKRGTDWTQFAFPVWWHYDILRGLEYFRRSGALPDARLAEAIALVESKRDADGRWLLDHRYAGAMPIEIDAPVGEPSRWNTLRAMRVLKWYQGK